jgi:hypothetical protein
MSEAHDYVKKQALTQLQAPRPAIERFAAGMPVTSTWNDSFYPVMLQEHCAIGCSSPRWDRLLRSRLAVKSRFTPY